MLLQLAVVESRLVYRRNNDVTSMIIIEAIAWTIVGMALLIGIVKWLG